MTHIPLTAAGLLLAHEKAQEKKKRIDTTAAQCI